MDMAADLRSRMAADQKSVAYVAELLGRSAQSVSRYRNGHEPIPLELARVLYRDGLLSAESILGEVA